VDTGRLLVAPRAAEAGTWRAKGYRNPAEWMAAQRGTSTGAAAEDLETGRRLADCPETGRALRDGDLSREQASAITDAATADPSADGDLVRKAKTGTNLKALRDEAKARKAAADPDPDATHRRLHRDRRVRTWTDREGAWCASLRGTTADGARVEAALRTATDHVFARARREGRREPTEAYMFDALVGLVTGLVAHPAPAPSPAATPQTSGTTRSSGTTGTTGTTGTSSPSSPRGSGEQTGSNQASGRAADPTPSTGSGPDPAADGQRDLADAGGWRLPPPATRSGADAKVIVLIDHQALCRGHTIAGETCEIAGIGPVPVSVVRDWMADAFLAAVIRDGTEITAVTHLGRRPTARQRTALQARGIRCTRAGCGRTDGLELDHRIDWHKTRHTCVDELDWLCTHDHSLKTLYRWALVPGTGQRDLVPPDDPRHPDRQTTGPHGTTSGAARPSAASATTTDPSTPADARAPAGRATTRPDPGRTGTPPPATTRAAPPDRSPPSEHTSGDQLTFAS
jgi:hypothetical protein